MAWGQRNRRLGQLTELSMSRSGQCWIIMKVYKLHVLSLVNLNIQAQEDVKENSL